MSNIGKSHWAGQLAAKAGFDWIDCDRLIEQKLGPELTECGYSGINDVARWMGQPYDAQYAANSKKYIDCERNVMREAISRLKNGASKPIVIDTTGSVIYTGEDILSDLKRLTKIVYLEAAPENGAHLYEVFFSEPKPVIWGDKFAPRAEEKPPDSLKRCYSELLQFRDRRYRGIAHVTIPFDRHKKPDADILALIGREK
jgi:shikimate kinase